MSSPASTDIHSQVSKAYGDRVRGVLEASDVLPVLDASSGCCAAPAAEETSCCGTDSGTDLQITRVAELYKDANVEDLPSTVTDVAFGCGNPTAIAALKPGETVLDLGSGGGIDCFLAAKMVGPSGKVFGVDMTPEMVTLARKNAEKVGATNVEFREGKIEALPIADASVDVIISNCVINLSPDKDAVFRDAFRVLRPGGRLQVSDIVWTKPVPDDVKGDLEAWVGCIAGALLESDYVSKIKAAGFVDVVSTAHEYAGRQGIASTNVVAVKP